MARNTVDITIDAEGRDKGKTFRLTEMPSVQGESWAIRALSAMARAGVEVPPELLSAGWGALAFMGARAILAAPYEETAPLLAEMMGCIQSVQPAKVRDLVDTDIEEITTRFRLRDEVFKLHAGFSLAGLLSSLASQMTPSSPPDETLTQTTPTLTDPSPSSSPPDTPLSEN